MEQVRKNIRRDLPYGISFIIGVILTLLLLPSFCRAQTQVTQHIYDHAGHFSEKR